MFSNKFFEICFCFIIYVITSFIYYFCYLFTSILIFCLLFPLIDNFLNYYYAHSACSKPFFFLPPPLCYVMFLVVIFINISETSSCHHELLLVVRPPCRFVHYPSNSSHIALPLSSHVRCGPLCCRCWRLMYLKFI